jgi:hypothetical protein
MGTVLKERTDAQEEIACLRPRVQVGRSVEYDVDKPAHELHCGGPLREALFLIYRAKPGSTP